MTESTKRAARIAWGLVLTLLSPGLGLVYARLLWSGLALLLLDEALSLGIVAVTQAYPPAVGPLQSIAALFGTALLMRVVVGWVVVRRLRGPPAPVRWFRSSWAIGALFVAAALGIDAATPPLGWRGFSIPSGSMIPTFEVGDMVLADIRAAGTRPVAGDVVMFAAPGPEGTIYVKRVVALAGETVAVRDGHLVITGRPTGLRWTGAVETEDGEARRYVETLPTGRSFPIQKLREGGPMNDTPLFVVPPGNVFVMGDNRDNSLDSRSLGLREGGPFGFVPFPNLLGTAALIYWPPSRAFTKVD